MQILPKMLWITVVVVYGFGVQFSFRPLNTIFYFISPHSVLYCIFAFVIIVSCSNRIAYLSIHPVWLSMLFDYVFFFRFMFI